MSDKTEKPHTQLQDETTSKKDRKKAKGELAILYSQNGTAFYIVRWDNSTYGNIID